MPAVELPRLSTPTAPNVREPPASDMVAVTSPGSVKRASDSLIFSAADGSAARAALSAGAAIAAPSRMPTAPSRRAVALFVFSTDIQIPLIDTLIYQC
ncbi:hypothetical protein ALI44B_13815 [Leifsonia sp. ALI-44-B]|nr:hypothetical protein ALI44B_13815 [Leifsonia sp. ALI-44-B]